VHRGPEAQARQNFNPFVQAVAAAGHTVVVPNVRGSTGYGKRWYSADDVRRRLDSVADLAAIHAALTARGRECELLVYGNEGHGLAQRSNREDTLPKAIAFLARHLAA
jgi:dipeptidyl aminopeptidase/acylaminoacyl peptidase